MSMSADRHVSARVGAAAWERHDVCTWLFGVSVALDVCSGVITDAEDADRDVLRAGSVHEYMKVCEVNGDSFRAALLAACYDLKTTAVLDEETQASLDTFLALVPRCACCRKQVFDFWENCSEKHVVCASCGDPHPDLTLC